MEAFYLLVLPAEELGEHDAGDGEGLVGYGGYLGGGFLCLGGDAAASLAHDEGEQEEEGDGDDADEGKLP